MWAAKGADGSSIAVPAPQTDSLELFAAHSPAPVRPRSRARAGLDAGRSLLVAVLAGLVVGALVATLELNPSYNYHTLLYMSFATGSLGIWAVATVVVAECSRTPSQAAVRAFFFLATVVLTYFCIRYVNFVEENRRIIESMSDVMDGRYGAVRHRMFWGQEKWVALWCGLGLAALAALDAWGMRRFHASRLYWPFALVPLFILAFEGWSYYVPMVLYVGNGLVPAAVDVAGLLTVSAAVVLGRRRDVAPGAKRARA